MQPNGTIFALSMKMRKIFTLLFVAFVSTTSIAQAQPLQEMPMPKVPAMRVLHHDYIDNDQKTILKLDGTDDSLFVVGKDPAQNQHVTDVLMIKINNLQARIETDSSLDENSKFKWLRGVHEMLTGFINGYRANKIPGTWLEDLINTYEQAMDAELHDKYITYLVARSELEIAEILVQNYALKNNKGIPGSQEEIVKKNCYRSPERVLTILSAHPNVYFADSIIISEAYKDPEVLYNYAAAPNALGRKIQSVNDPLVKKIGLLALMKTGRLYFPFLDNLYRNKLSMDSVTKVLNDEEAYYKLLVKTEIDYAGRMHSGDTPLVRYTLTEMLKRKGVEYYINEINALHDEKLESVRFKKLDNLTPEELYYLAVLGEEEIYTSSYVSGVYPRIFQRMKNPSSDTLLHMVNYDYYRKFIKIAANYNTLDDFLKRMDKTSAQNLMRNFVTGLEKTKSLEDAVDVANSYASISDPFIRRLMMLQIEKNLIMSEASGDPRGKNIYNLLHTIFLSMDSTSKVDIAAELGIDGVYEMPYTSLVDDKNRVVIQQFFYGDKDGKGIFNDFKLKYSNANWRITDKPEWIEVTSVKGKPVTIYCNKPLDEDKGLDAQAQASLDDYLSDNDIHPTIVIHRGHSYFVGSTIKQLPSSAKVVLLGSCGGYHSLHDVLETCKQAHIISSKQTGTGAVNIRLIMQITEDARLGKPLNWPAVWKAVEAKIPANKKEGFEDYVAPHKNLGAIFIMAYQQQEEKQARQQRAEAIQ